MSFCKIYKYIHSVSDASINSTSSFAWLVCRVSELCFSFRPRWCARVNTEHAHNTHTHTMNMPHVQTVCKINNNRILAYIHSSGLCDDFIFPHETIQFIWCERSATVVFQLNALAACRIPGTRPLNKQIATEPHRRQCLFTHYCLRHRMRELINTCTRASVGVGWLGPCSVQAQNETEIFWHRSFNAFGTVSNIHFFEAHRAMHTWSSSKIKCALHFTHTHTRDAFGLNTSFFRCCFSLFKANVISGG